MLDEIYHKRSTQKETVAMDYPNHITNHEKGKHLSCKDDILIVLRPKDGRKANSIAWKMLNLKLQLGVIAIWGKI